MMRAPATPFPSGLLHVIATAATTATTRHTEPDETQRKSEREREVSKPERTPSNEGFLRNLVGANAMTYLDVARAFMCIGNSQHGCKQLQPAARSGLCNACGEGEFLENGMIFTGGA